MIDVLQDRRVALAHDWLVGLRGGERVLDRLAVQFGPTDLYVLVNDGRPLTEAIDACRVVTSPLQRLPGATGRWRRHYLPVMPWAVERLHVAPCDVLISTSSAVMKSIRPPAGTKHLCYCHSPARYVWEQTADYEHGSGGLVRRVGLRLVGNRFRRWDRATADRVTRFVANSEHSAARVRRCFDREAGVVYPPVRTNVFTPGASSREEWFLVVAALEPYKRTELAIEAANRHGFPLKVVGGGSQAEELAHSAGPSVEMMGRVSDDALLDLYRRAQAMIFPQVEDFGITAVEAQSAGCPLVAFRAGGAAEIVAADSGLFFDAQTVDALVDAVRGFDAANYPQDACRANAERFSEEVFDAAMRGEVEALL